MVAYLAKDNRTVAIDFDSVAPAEFRPELFQANPKQLSLDGYLAITVPAVVAGLDLALRELGTMSFAQVAAHARRLAEDGFLMDALLKSQLDEWRLKADEESRHAYVPQGQVVPVGQRWRQPDLARLLGELSDRGPRALYDGDIPRRIVRHVRSHGGILSEKDFTNYQARFVQPLSMTYRNHRLVTSPAPAGGITVLQILKTLERFDIAAMDPAGGEFFHILAEAIKLCWRDRVRYLGDPDFVSIPVEQMLSDASAAERAEMIRAGSVLKGATAQRETGAHTVNISAVDRERNIVSMTATQGFIFGSTVVVPGLGLILGHGMSRFDFEAGHPNSPAPGKRMQHNMSPMIATQEGRPVFVCGLPGGAKIVPVTTRLVVDALDYRMSPGKSLTMPRIHVETDEPVFVSTNMPAETTADLRRRGHEIKVEPKLGGAANSVSIDPSTGKITAANILGSDCVAAE
jgi:gamma-glutamyltranspeptidase/glutathione hydrolase